MEGLQKSYHMKTRTRSRPRKRPAPVYWDWVSDLFALATAGVVIYALTLVTLYLFHHL